ncbi:DUF736 family protein [Phenylobacterium deserti]|uniref:DUF736 family protein n=1 Tax=Phenylobacterium deserti TaxID=1914756 RepID=UPI0030B81AAA
MACGHSPPHKQATFDVLCPGCGPAAAGPVVPVLRSPSARHQRGTEPRGTRHGGTFTRESTGNYYGSIKTLRLKVKQAPLRPLEKTTDQAPDYRMDMGDRLRGGVSQDRARIENTFRSS